MTIRSLIVRSRPRFWLYLAGPVLLGLVYGAKQPGELIGIIPVVLAVYFLIPANVFLYGINDIFDADIDKLNPKKSGPERRYRGDDGTLAWVTIAALLGIGVALVVPIRVTPWIVGFLLVGFTYSAPPFRFKTRPPLDSLSNGLYILPAIAAFVLVGGTLPPIEAIVGGWLWTMAMHTFSAIPDIESDREAGIQTIATRLGSRGANVYCGVVWLLSAVAFTLIDIRLGLTFLVYPLLLGVPVVMTVSVDRMYWWYPWVNGAIGGLLTLAGIWRLLHG